MIVFSKRRSFLLFVSFFCSFQLLSRPCPMYQEMMVKGEKALQDKAYEEALKYYFTAQMVTDDCDISIHESVSAIKNLLGLAYYPEENGTANDEKLQEFKAIVIKRYYPYFLSSVETHFIIGEFNNALSYLMIIDHIQPSEAIKLRLSEVMDYQKKEQLAKKYLTNEDFLLAKNLYDQLATKFPKNRSFRNELKKFSGFPDPLLQLDTQKTNAITHLHLRESGLTEMSKKVSELSELEYLDLSDNDIKYLPSEIKNLTKLEVLRLSYNNLEYLPKEFTELLNLKKLYLENNPSFRFHVNMNDLGKLTQLKELYLADNNLQKLPQSLEELSTLKEVRLSGNPALNINNIIDLLSQNKQLEWLYLSNMNIKKLPQSIQQFQALIHLNLSQNKELLISEALPYIAELPLLEYLDLSDNNITVIPKEIFLLKKLMVLNLKGNRILSTDIKKINTLLPDLVLFLDDDLIIND